MTKALNDGIPSIDDFDKLIKSDFYIEMEQYSESFVVKNRDNLIQYANKWVGNPLKQWSRQWEYPYVFSVIQQYFTENVESNKSLKVLDAGSGATFFPYYLLDNLTDVELYCCDYDSSLKSIYADLNQTEQANVTFSNADLRSLNLPKESFDVIYCISVLEHTDAYEQIVDEFYATLKPGGSLIITFDISIDATRDISIERGDELLNILYKRFNYNSEQGAKLQQIIDNSSVYTTKIANEIDSDLLPWKKNKLQKLLNSTILRKHKKCPPLLTFYCLSLTKPA